MEKEIIKILETYVVEIGHTDACIYWEAIPDIATTIAQLFVIADVNVLLPTDK